jgi:MFS family permease
MVSFPHREGKRDLRTPAAQGFRSASRRASAAVQALSVGTGPLRDSRDFRLLSAAVLPSGLAMGAVGLAVFVQTNDLGGAAALGYLGLVQFGFLTLGTLGGSAIVDHVDRRLLLLITQAAFVVSVTTLLIGSLHGQPPMALIYVTSAWGSAVSSLYFPTRSAMIPPVVERVDLTTAITLDTVAWNVTMILGPILGGFVLAKFGLAAVYGSGALAHLVTLVMMLRLSRQPADKHRDGRLGFSAIRHGFAYMRPRPVLKGLLWIDLIAMAFGMRRALFPILAVQQFGRGPEVVGLLMAAIPAGALAMSLTAGWLEHVHRQGLGLVAAAAVWGAAVAAFGLSGANLWLGLLLLAVAGGADVVAAILRATIIQHEVPEFVRGRVWGINFLVLNGGPRLGDMTAGMTAAAWGATFSVVAGGVAALIGTGVFAVCVPELTRYTSAQGIDPVDDGQTALRGEA